MLSIIIPTYNRPDRLREALQSLTIQTKRAFYVVVCDDCSEDQEAIINVCNEFDNALHIEYLRAAVNGGPGEARQMGLKWAIDHNMELVMFMDSDDILFPNAVEALTHEINHGLFDFVGSDIVVEHKHEPQTIIPAEDSITWFHGKIYRVAYLKAHNIHFPVGLRTNEDLAFNLCAYWEADKCSYIKAQLYLWRDDNNSITRGDTQMRNDAMGIDYIRAVYYAINTELKKNISNPKVMIPNLLMCYNYYQACLARGEEIPDEIKRKLHSIYTNERIKELLNKTATWDKSRKYLWQYVIDKKKVLYFPETFETWYRRIIDESICY